MAELFAISCPSTELGARAALRDIMARLTADGQGIDKAGMIEVALAEVINNIVEHAYQGREAGEIRILCRRTAAALEFETVDRGAALPGESLPEGGPADLAVPRNRLPEGGFGWMLIRSLTSDLRYSRRDGENHLVIRFDLPKE